MATKTSRVTVTQNGRRLQRDLLENATLNTPLSRTTTSSPQPVNYPSDPITAGFFKCRSGYFRPKKLTHQILKPSDAERLYPNYMRSDPHEYPEKHECAWHPKSTSPSRKRVPSAAPVTKYVHHTLYKTSATDQSNNSNTAKNPTITETNHVLAGDHGYLTMNLTSCKYPSQKIYLPQEEVRRKASSPLSQLFSPTSMNNFRPQSVMSTPHLSNAGFKVPLESAIPGYGVSPNNGSARSSSISVLQTLGKQRPTSQAYRSTYKKVSEEKFEQIVEKYEQTQKNFGKILVKLKEKVQEKVDKVNEAPVYLKGFDGKLRRGGSRLEDLAMEKHDEETRYRQRLHNYQERKYRKSWDKWDGFMDKTKLADKTSWATMQNQTYGLPEEEMASMRKNKGLFIFENGVLSDKSSRKTSKAGLNEIRAIVL